MLLLTLFPTDRSASGFSNLSWAALRAEVMAGSGFLLGEAIDQHSLYCQEFMAMIGNVASRRKLDERFVAFDGPRSGAAWAIDPFAVDA